MFFKMLTLLDIVLVIISKTTSQPYQRNNSVELKNQSYEGQTYGDGKYYVDVDNETERECTSMNRTCVLKCCPPGKAYNPSNGCTNEPLTSTLYFDHRGKPVQSLVKEIEDVKETQFFNGSPNCSKEKNEKLIIWPKAFKSSITIRKNGSLCLNISPKCYQADKYCVDTFVSEGESYFNALICRVVEPETNNYPISSTCLLISCFFILLTVAVYAWISELRNLHGMIMMAYLICFFVGFLCLATMQILSLHNSSPRNVCTGLSIIIYFSLQAAFFWSNVMCYDIWWTFSGICAHGRSGSPHKRFSYYAMYAFGIPTALTILLVALEFSNLPITHPLLPKLSLQGCFLYGNSKLLYFYGPILIICVANIIFSGLTAYKIWKIKRETERLRSTQQDNTDRFSLFVKLFTVMGINWILEVICSHYSESDFIWRFTDAYNVLVGFIIFIIFVCKRKTWELIKKRFLTMMGKQVISRTQTTSSSTRTHSISRDEVLLNSIKK